MKQARQARHCLVAAVAAVGVAVLSGDAQASSQGPLSGSSAGQGTSIFEDWVSPGAILASDDTRATVTLASDETSERIVPSDFGFAIPTGATIDGIEVNVERRGVGVSGTPETRIFLRKDDNSSVGPKLDTSAWPASDSILTVGGPSDLWGTTWTIADINGANFRSQIQVAAGASDSGTFELDHVTVTVYFTPAAVPALSPRGLFLLALALVTLGYWVSRASIDRRDSVQKRVEPSAARVPSTISHST